MKKFISTIALSSLLFTSDLFAQNPVEVKSMDMNEYASWMGLVMIFMIFTMFALFMIHSSKEHKTAAPITHVTPGVISNPGSTIITGNTLQVLPGISIEINKIRIMLISTLILFILIMILMIFQK